MVSIVVSDGRREAALRLERLWNDLAEVIPFALLCAYPIGGFDSESHGCCRGTPASITISSSPWTPPGSRTS
jgi:hypothetical protein